ncbi:hypothetical protein MHBO_001195 [Bonamia ostreae]|uniref:Uncharacterized protein n=1 Tax=Bonamia ostreae TaxID=126728 RepID=A0ABV2AIA9_9EUKA
MNRPKRALRGFHQNIHRTDSSDFYEFKVSGSNWELVLVADSEDVDLYISTQHGEVWFNFHLAGFLQSRVAAGQFGKRQEVFRPRPIRGS